MVRAGKFGLNSQGLQFAMNIARPPEGLNTPTKRFWFGTITKRFDWATADVINLRGPTWGFQAIEYAQIWTKTVGATTDQRKYAGAGFGAGVGTVIAWYNKAAATLRVPRGPSISRATTGAQIWLMVFGR